MKKITKITGYIVLVIVICLLAFIKLQKNKASNAETAELANIQGDFYPVKIITIKPVNLKTNISTTGFLESVSDLIVLSETQGTIKSIFKKKGDNINKNEVIAKVDDELLKAQYDAAKASYEQLLRDVERYAKLYEQHAVTSQSLEQMKLNMESAKAQYITANRQLENTEIKAPISGFIENDFIKLGQYISGGAQICNIIDAKNLKLRISISEYDYNFLKIGQKVSVVSAIYPNKTFTGDISYIGKKAGYGNNFEVEITVANTGNLLKAGMFVTASLTDVHKEQSIYVPRRAIVGSLKKATVFVVDRDKVQLKEIVTGNIQDNKVQIVKGLNNGDQIVVEGNYNLFDGATVKVMD